MSADATGWVYRHSPFRGATFAIHQAIADSVNDQHNNEFWMRLDRLATKARVTRPTASKCVSELRERGYLVLVKAASKGRRPSRYLFLFPTDASVIYETRTVTRDDGSDSGPSAELTATVTRADSQPSAEATHIPSRTQVEPKSPPVVPPDDAEFDEFWAQYPHKIAKPKARQSWRRAIKTGADPDAIISGLISWIEHWRIRGEPEYIPYPTTWLNQERWNDRPPRINPPKSRMDVLDILGDEPHHEPQPELAP